MEQFLELISGRTAFSGKIEKVDEMPIPTLTLCLQPYFKPSMSQKYSANSMIALLESQNGNKWESFNNLSYSIDKDFEIELIWYENDIKHTQALRNGSNVFSNGSSIKIKPIATLRHGRCYLLKADFNVTVQRVTYVSFKINFNPSLSQLDTPNNIEIFMTSPDGWFGIYADDWPYFEPTYFTISTKHSHLYEWVTVLVPTKLQFKEGHEDIRKCIQNFVHSLNCKKKCFPVVFNNIPNLEPCTILEDHKCMYDEGINKEKGKMVTCLTPVTTMQYR